MRWSERGGPPYNNPPYYLSAYGLAVKHGFKGTEEEYLASLKGETEEPDIETVLSGVTMPYTEANYAIAQAEAYQGQITAEDDGAPAPPPTAQEQLRADVDFLAAMQGVAL